MVSLVGHKFKPFIFMKNFNLRDDSKHRYLVSMVVDSLPEHYFKAELLLFTLGQFAQVPAANMLVQCVDRVDAAFVHFVQESGYRTRTIAPYLDGAYCNKLQQLAGLEDELEHVERPLPARCGHGGAGPSGTAGEGGGVRQDCGWPQSAAAGFGTYLCCGWRQATRLHPLRLGHRADGRDQLERRVPVCTGATGRGGLDPVAALGTMAVRAPQACSTIPGSGAAPIRLPWP